MEHRSRSFHFWVAHGFILLSALGGVAVFALLPFLFAYSHTSHSAQEGIVAGVTTTSVQGSLIRYPSLVPMQSYQAIDPESVTAESFSVVDTKTGDLLAGKNADQPHPLASLTKLVSVLLLMERGLEDSSAAVDPQTITENVVRYDIPFDVNDAASRIRLGVREEFNADDLLQAALIASANDAMFALVDSQGLDPDTFRTFAENYFSARGFTHTTLVEPSGLDYRNTSTAYEYATLARQAVAYAEIRKAMQSASAVITSTTTFHTYSIQTTNALLEQNDAIIAGKTGYLDASGYTFVTLARHQSGREVIIVLLGSQSTSSRIEDMERIVTWLNTNLYKMGSNP